MEGAARKLYMGKKYYTTTEYAKLHGITRQAVNHRIKVGTLKAEMIGGRWLIPAKVVDKEEKNK